MKPRMLNMTYNVITIEEIFMRILPAVCWIKQIACATGLDNL